MLKVILNRLKLQVEAIIAEEPSGFGACRITGEQILNLIVLCEKYVDHQHPIPYFIDAKNAFDRVQHAVLWATLKKFIPVMTSYVQSKFYTSMQLARFYTNNLLEWFKIRVGVRQGCLLSHMLFNVFQNESWHHVVWAWR